VTAKALAAAELVLPEATWRTQDASRVLLNRFAQEAGQSLQTRVECEDVETALELVQRGLADSVVQRAVLDELGPRLAPDVGWVSLRPRLYDTIAVVHRKDAVLSTGARW
jgi:DNA-binding transcriptional LysR family regulator